MSAPWRLFWLSVGAGPLFGLALLFLGGLLIGLLRQVMGLPTGDLAAGSALLVLGLPFAHIFGGIPAAISAGLNIAVARYVRSRRSRLLLAPLCGAVSGLAYLPLIGPASHEPLEFMLSMMALCALTSLLCVLIHEHRSDVPAPQA